MKYLTKAEFKTAVGNLENLRGSRFARTLWNDWGEGIFNFIDMEPGIIYIKEIKGSSPTIQYLTLNDSSINREWVRIYNSTTITTLNAPMNCEIYSTTSPTNQYYQSIYINTEKNALTYGNARRLELNGYVNKTLKIYTYGSISPPFMNWAENPFD